MEIVMYFEMQQWKTTYQKLWDSFLKKWHPAKIPRGKYDLKCIFYIRQQDRSKMNQLSVHLEKSEKGQSIPPNCR